MIRGVAGSGKTVVLIRNCVRLVQRLNAETISLLEHNAERRIAVVCFDITLVERLRDMLDEELRSIFGDALPAVRVDVFHMAGLQSHLFYQEGGRNFAEVDYLYHRDYRDEKSGETDTARIARDYVAQLDRCSSDSLAQLQYEAIFVDEGQDFFGDEYRLLVKLLRTQSSGDKSIVIFYDDAQNLYGRRRPNWSELGIQVAGRRSEIMRQCHRNTREIVEFAFNVLLGASAETRVATRQFADTATLIANGLIEELPDRWLIHFAERRGPFPETHFFASRSEEHRWLLQKLRELLQAQGVRSEDILLLFERSTAEASSLR